MVVAGPGVPQGKVSQKVVMNIDIAPTITELTAAANGTTYKDVLRGMDGQSMVPLLQDAPSRQTEGSFHREQFLVSYHGVPFDIYTTRDTVNNTYHCVRTIIMNNEEMHYEKNDIYCRFVDDEHFVEYYDMTSDEWQLSNSVNSLSHGEISTFELKLALFKSCHGENCRHDGSARLKRDTLS